MEPLVSVITVTYNHAPYIRACIEGVLMQKTTFPIEHIIGEDFSTDGTRAIVLEYAQKYPEIIRLVTSDSNVGVYKNSRRASEATRGKYIAWCEGDDYWTDPLKLQKQVDFLEAHPDYAMCFHNTLFTYEDGRPPELMHVKPWDSCTLEEMILNFNDFAFPNKVTAGHTSSMVYRAGLLKNDPAWFSQSVSGDIPFQILLAQYGKAKFINEVMSVYRKHGGGVSSAPEHEGLKLYENRILVYEGLKQALDKQYGAALDQVLAQYYTHVGDIYCNQLKLRQAYGYYRRTAGRGRALGMLFRYVSGHFASLDLVRQSLDAARVIYHRVSRFWREVLRRQYNQ